MLSLSMTRTILRRKPTVPVTTAHRDASEMVSDGFNIESNVVSTTWRPIAKLTLMIAERTDARCPKCQDVS